MRGIAAGAYHSLATTTNGRVLSCGDNTYGALGHACTEGSAFRFAPISGPPDLLSRLQNDADSVVTCAGITIYFYRGTAYS